MHKTAHNLSLFRSRNRRLDPGAYSPIQAKQEEDNEKVAEAAAVTQVAEVPKEKPQEDEEAKTGPEMVAWLKQTLTVGFVWPLTCSYMGGAHVFKSVKQTS